MSEKIVFPVIINKELILYSFSIIDRKLETIKSINQFNVIDISYSDDYLVGLFEDGHVILLRNMQTDINTIFHDCSTFNFRKVYCCKNLFFAIDDNEQLYIIEWKGSNVNIIALNAPISDFKVLSLTSGDITYILDMSGRIFRIVKSIINPFSFKIMEPYNQYLPPNLPEGITAISIEGGGDRFYIIDTDGNLYKSDVDIKRTPVWEKQSNIKNIKGFTFNRFYGQFLFIDGDGHLIKYRPGFPQHFGGLESLIEISGIKDYFLAITNTGKLVIGHVTLKDIISFITFDDDEIHLH